MLSRDEEVNLRNQIYALRDSPVAIALQRVCTSEIERASERLLTCSLDEVTRWQGKADAHKMMLKYLTAPPQVVEKTI